MIPKIIHYTWFSNDPYPETVQQCLDSWKRHLPDYEIRHWDMAAIAEIDSVFLKEAIQEKKWAYAADFVRLYALYHHGGIYMDTDVLLYQSFDHLLHHQAFIGKETSIHIEGGKQEMYLSSHCMGAEPQNEYIKRCLSYFDQRPFVLSTNEYLPKSLRFNQVLLPYIQSEIAKEMGYDPKPLSQKVQTLEDVTIYPSHCFDCVKPRPDSVCRHLALGSWRDYDYRQAAHLSLYQKIGWRIRFAFQYLASLFNYTLIKLS